MAEMTRREFLISELLKMKEAGYRVFINRLNEDDLKRPEAGRFLYGLIAKDDDIIYVQFGDYGSWHFHLCYNYVPSRDYGSGTSNGLVYASLTPEAISEITLYGHAYTESRKGRIKRYAGIEDFMKDTFHARNYEEL